jgi:hypothetical protein
MGANEEQFIKGKSSVTDLMTKGARQQTVDTDMPVRHAVAQLMENIIAMLPPGIELAGKRPKYLRYHIWDPDGAVAETAVEWTEQAKPLPRPSSVQLMHPVIHETITKNPSLFKIVTPIKIQKFEDLLLDHPNQDFVKSVCKGLHYGFWPWADIWKPGYPDELDLT